MLDAAARLTHTAAGGGAGCVIRFDRPLAHVFGQGSSRSARPPCLSCDIRASFGTGLRREEKSYACSHGETSQKRDGDAGPAAGIVSFVAHHSVSGKW
jgi:hypothetical protein